MKIRVFLAIKLPENTLNEILLVRNSLLNDTKITWERKENLHLTIKFFGERDEETIRKIIEETSLITNAQKPLKIIFHKFGFFNKEGSPRILYLGLKKNDELKNLFHILESKFEKYGIQKEQRNFNPHLTLLRIKSRIDSLNIFENKTLQNLSFTCNSLSLIKSDLTKSGAVYTEIYKFNFKEA